MKKIKLLLVLNLFGFLSLAQNSPIQQWVNTAAGSTSGDEAPTCSYRDNVGFTYVAGNNTNGTFIVKFDNTGLVVYSRQYVDSNNVNIVPKIIQPDASGNIYLSGYKFYGGEFHIAAIKMDSGGNVLWETSYNTHYGAIYLDAMVCDNPSSPGFFAYTGKINDSISVGKINLASGDFLFNTRIMPALGYTSGRGLDIKFQGGNLYCTGVLAHPTTMNDAFIMKINGTGSFMYLNTFNGSVSSFDYGAKVVVNSSGEAFIYGTAYDPAYQFFVAKFNSVGGMVWKTAYTPPAGDAVTQPMDMAFDNLFTKIYTLGQTTKTGVGNGAIALFDPSTGAISFSTIVSYPIGSSDEQFRKIVVDNSNNYYISAINNGSQFMVTKRSPANVDVFHSYYSLPATGLVGLHVDNTGNTFLTGSINQSTSTYNDVAIVKYSSSGAMLWDGYFDDQVNSSDYNGYLLTDNSGNITLVGNVSNSLTDLDAIVRKYDPKGNLLWSNTLDYGTTYNMVTGYAQSLTNDIYVATNNSAGYCDITKIDINGNVLWNATTPVVSSTGFSCNAAGDYFYQGENYVTGQMNFNVSKFGFLGLLQWTSVPQISPSYTTILTKTINDASDNLYAFGLQLENSTKYWLYLEKYNSAGVWQWGTKITGHDSTGFTYAGDIQLDPSGNLIISGSLKKLSGYDAAAVAKINASTGNIMFKNFYNAGDTHNQSTASSFVDNTGQIYLTGNYSTITSPMAKMACVLKFDNSGTFLWEYNHTTIISSDYFAKAAIDVDGNVIASGSLAYNPNPFTWGAYSLTVKLNPLTGTKVWEKIFETNYPGGLNGIDMKLFNNRIYISGAGLMSPGNNEDLVVLKYCDNPAPNILQPSVNTVCNGQIVDLSLTGVFDAYEWNPGGETTPVLHAGTSGQYSVTITELDGCSKVSDTVSVNIKALPATPSICAVTVDSLSTHNIIYWDKSGYTDVSEFIVYREDITNIYSAVGVVPFDSLSEFHDYGADPNITTKRYKISAVDTCGTESLKSNYHNTLYVTANGTGDFSWNLYEIEASANPVVSFELLRNDDGVSAWNVISTTAGTQQILSDPAFASFPNGLWFVRTVWGISCTPTRAGISTSRSNIRNKSALMGLNSNAQDNSVVIYPNPALNSVNIRLNDVSGILKTVYLKDASGRLIEEKSLVLNSAEFNLTNVERGIYFIEVVSTEGRIVKQFAKL